MNLQNPIHKFLKFRRENISQFCEKIGSKINQFFEKKDVVQPMRLTLKHINTSKP